jgi:SAM-dependent methyltransferase
VPEAVPVEAPVLTVAEAAATAAELRPFLPARLAPEFGPRFVRSASLYEEFVHRLVLGAFRESGLEDAARPGGEAREIAARAGLPRRALAPVDWMLRHLAARGRLETTTIPGAGAAFRLAGSLPLLDPAPLAEEQARHDPSWLPSYLLAETIARDYPAFLHGRVTGEAILFSPARLRLWLDYFSNDNGLYAVNNRVGALALAEWLPPGAGGAILELGGGLGSGAVAALESLEGAGRLGELGEYRFTEVVPAFLRRGRAALERRFPGASFLSFAQLDMNQPFGQQGVAAGSVAATYAVNTLHVAHDLRATLTEILRALAPGGRLVVGECIRPYPGQTVYAEFVFNLMEAFRAPRLDTWRPNGGFLTPEQWVMALEAAGFVDVRLLPDVRRIRDRFPMFYVAALGATRPA